MLACYHRLIRAGVLIMVAAWPALASAELYPQRIDVENEQDLAELHAHQTLDDEDYLRLLDLMNTPIDLTRASRRELHALPNLSYADVDRILDERRIRPWNFDLSSLVERGVLSVSQARELTAFVRADANADANDVLSGRMRYRTALVPPSKVVPPMAFESVMEWRYLRAGITLNLERRTLRQASYDPSRDAWVTEGTQLRVWPARFALEWNSPRWHIVVGTFSVGFAQRLTLDTTTRSEPHGVFAERGLPTLDQLVPRCRASAGERDESPCATDRVIYELPDYKTSSTLTGIAVGFHPSLRSRAAVEAHGWLSLQSPPTRLSDIVRPERCHDDPERGRTCESEVLYQISAQDRWAPAVALTAPTLPHARLEIMGGVDVGVRVAPRARLGLRGYGAMSWWRLPGPDLEWAPNAALPATGRFGALGVDAAWGFRGIDLLAEGSLSLRAASGRPRYGLAGILTARWSRGVHDLDASVRYFGPSYVNPYSGATAAPDEIEGLRTRNEVGGRFRYTGQPWSRLRVSILLDLYAPPGDRDLRVWLRIHHAWTITRWLVLGIDVDWRDRDLTTTGRHHCYDGDPPASATTSDDADPRCRGEAIRTATTLRLVPHPRLSIRAAYAHRWLDSEDLDGRETTPYRDRFRNDGSAALDVTVRPIDVLRLRLRGRWSDEKLATNAYGAQTASAGLQVDVRHRGLFVSLGYEVFWWLDERSSTLVRHPNPEHWVQLQIEGRFARDLRPRTRHAVSLTRRRGLYHRGSSPADLRRRPKTTSSR